jgi:hypothetical protein
MPDAMAAGLFGLTDDTATLLAFKHRLALFQLNAVKIAMPASFNS